ncbi:MAG: desulfoferrodoxin [Bacteroidales bacterium]|nr:desulfoferrodoxin [Bacteroidales bacterium]
MNTQFYRCEICGNVVIKTVDSGISVVCCGEEMEELIPKTNDTGVEKHLPVVTKLNENTYKVDIGSTEHPMMPSHYIQFIYLETTHGGQIAYLSPNDKPTATFHTEDKVTAVYEFCSIHGLWKTEVK